MYFTVDRRSEASYPLSHFNPGTILKCVSGPHGWVGCYFLKTECFSDTPRVVSLATGRILEPRNVTRGDIAEYVPLKAGDRLTLTEPEGL